MQTFFPYTKPRLSARVLDYRRLGKQRVEAKQVLQYMLDVDKFGKPGNTGQIFPNHPIHKMWCGYEEALLSYTWYICKEWRDRGYRDSIMPWLFTVAHARGFKVRPWNRVSQPWWVKHPRIQIYHRANLLVKFPGWYSTRPAELGLRSWEISLYLQSGLGYYWPMLEPDTWKLIRRPNR